ncbi:MAG: GGDEF domain-containing protein [Ruminococcus sp.]|nr:GGDEF domain-containing protein [Ruminococcus sp.]
MQKVCYIVNSSLLGIVVLMMGFFKVIGADFLVAFSIPTIAVYIIMFVMIYKQLFRAYVWTCYGWITVYMGLTAVFLGEEYGFQLYCFSLIPVVHITEYISFRMNRKGVKALFISVCIAVFYFIFMSYLKVNGAIYDCGGKYALLFWIVNSLSVFGFLVVYAHYIVRSVILSEKKLVELAHKDSLTKLSNRHYMLEKLLVLPENDTRSVLAMADIDDFKKINDTYGHNAGDEVLKMVSSKMQENCKGCEIARWGGEEFLILYTGEQQAFFDMLENMRTAIAENPVVFEGRSISVALTAGVAHRNSGESIDDWIMRVDEKLYIGKNNGKNMIVM